MADQEVENGGAEKVITHAKSTMDSDLIAAEVGIEAPKAADAVQFYKKVFGAVEIKRFPNLKRKVDVEQPLLQVLLQFGSCKVLVVDCLEDELKTQATGAFHVVSWGDAETLIRKVVAAGGITEGAGRTDHYAFPENLCSVKVKDPFGVLWTIVGNKLITPASENPDDNNTSTADVEAWPNNTTAVEAGPDNTEEA